MYHDDSGNGAVEAGEILDENHYYAYGMEYSGFINSTEYAYKFNGIERVEAFQSDFAFYRGLDPILGRWYQVDPYAESFYSMSPYCAMGSNPIMYVDPQGDFIAQVVGAIVGAGVNVVSNWDKVLKNPWSAIGYAASGAVGGAVATVNPALGRSIAAFGNVATDIASGNIPSFDSFEDGLGYAAGVAMDAFSVGNAGKIGNLANSSLKNAAKAALKDLSGEVLGSGAFGQDQVFESSLDIINDGGKVLHSFGDAGVKPIITAAKSSLIPILANGVSATLGVHGNTPPQLPNKTIVNQDGVKIEHNYHSNDHKPAHAHVKGGGPKTKIGANGKPIKGFPELSPKQESIISQNKGSIRTKINKIKKWLYVMKK